jgi:hypothetical protein
MSLHEKILVEHTEEQRRRGRPLGQFYGLDSPALDRQLVNAPKDRLKYGADLRKLDLYIRKGVHSPGAAMHFASLKAAPQGVCRAQGRGPGAGRAIVGEGSGPSYPRS